MKLFACGLAAALMTSVAHAAPILILSGASMTSEEDTTQDVVSNMTALHEAAGNTVTVADNNGDVDDLSVFSQVWDVRFSNAWALTPAEVTEYIDYMDGGGNMFVMGDNSSFDERNMSIRILAFLAGGGSIGDFETAILPQTVQAPFNAPNPVDSILLLGAVGVSSPGTGSFILNNGAYGSGVTWGVGDLANAMSGTLTAMFDVNFWEADNADAQVALAANLMDFAQSGIEAPAVPLPASLPLMLAGLGGLAALRRRG